MWFKELKDHEALLKPALETWPVLTGYFKKRHRIVNKLTFSAIHYRYSMNLKEVAPGAKLPEKADGLRVLVSDSNGPLVFHDMSLNPKKPKVFSTRLDAGIIDDFVEVNKRLKQSGIKEEDGEIRQFSLLPLNVEAIWYSRQNGAQDNFFIKRHDSTKLESMDKNVFLTYLNKLKGQLKEALKATKNGNGKKSSDVFGG